ncbi:MAG: HEPN domain-containing protein [Planctomycetes bacterium]|nr:HEPN domain-containing protein [Planctomycetota bacterium]
MKSYEAWLVKAEHDLASAQRLSEGAKPILDTAIYHTQQCAEKALKAYLSFMKQPIEKTHDVEHLVGLCATIDESFNSLLNNAKVLTPYDTAFRYPDFDMVPDMEDVLDAIEKAKSILDFVKGRI